jgi:hypothetical protein
MGKMTVSGSDAVELIAKATTFLSQLDETAFFEWLSKISCVSKFTGQDDILYIQITRSKVDQSSLRDLLALFYRYKIDMKQLAIFDRAEFSEWFRRKEAYWHDQVFAE